MNVWLSGEDYIIDLNQAINIKCYQSKIFNCQIRILQMPDIIDENDIALKSRGEFSGFGNDTIKRIIDFCMPRALFSIRRASSAFLKLPTDAADQTSYIEKRLSKICVSDDLAISFLIPGAAPQQAHQWICYTIPPVGMPPTAGSRLSSFTFLQETAFNSPHAIANYSLLQRISLAWSYEGTFISEVLGVNNFANTPLEMVVNSENISYMINHNNYHNMMTTPIPMGNNNLIIQKLAFLGVTQVEFNKIQLQIRQFIILNQIALDRKEIDFITDKKNEALFLSGKLINSIKQLIAMSPTIQQSGGNVANSHENTGNLIKPKLSSICKLYKQGSNRIDYLVVWLQNHLQSLGIYQDSTQHIPTSLSISQTIYGHINQELDSVIYLLQSDYLTADDIEVSKANGYDLYMLQAKTEAEANRRGNAVLIFSANNVSTSSVQQLTDEPTTTEQIAAAYSSRPCIIQ